MCDSQQNIDLHTTRTAYPVAFHYRIESLLDSAFFLYGFFCRKTLEIQLQYG